MRSQQILFLEFNEININSVRRYVSQGHLPSFAAFIKQHGITETISEKNYDDLEPWIQWVTAHTGLTAEEHSVRRLGDIVNHDFPQIWERLEDRGLKVGAISPMNAKCRASAPAFFIPDPWTATGIVAPPIYKRMYAAISQAVNNNADQKLSVLSLASLVLGMLKTARPTNYRKYITLALSSRRAKWRRALFLDLLLADLFVHFLKKTEPDFATIFLNAGAHIQHHYMFSSPVCEGGARGNPAWYLEPGFDPVLEVYKLYDEILADIQHSFPSSRLMFATGLHQDPYPEVTFYWRLKDHAAFLGRIGVDGEVEPRMSRDFLIKFRTVDGASEAEMRLSRIRDQDGLALFEVDNRGDSLFVMLTYPRDVTDETMFVAGNAGPAPLRPEVTFVALKNGQHNGTGYFSDTGRVREVPRSMQLKSIPDVIMSAFSLADLKAAQ